METMIRRDVGRPISEETSRAFADMTMIERKQFVTERCQEVRRRHENSEPVGVKATILLDRKNNLISCINYKVGSRSVIKALRAITDQLKAVDPHLWPQMKKNSSTKSLMFVREPLRRLLSAYSARRGVRIANGTSLVPFATFLEDLLQTNDDYKIDPHHLSYYLACRPCDFTYDYIGTMATFSDDLRYIMQRFNIDMGDISRIGAREISATEDDAIIKSVPADIRRGIWNMYKEDYTLFGYSKPF